MPGSKRPSLGRGLFVGWQVVRGLSAHGAFRSAAAVAYWFFLSLIPLLVLVGFAAGQVARRRGVDALVGPLLGLVPSAAEDIVREELTRLAGARATSLAPVGAATFLWTASAGLHTLADVFEVAASTRRRTYWHKRFVALVGVLIGVAATTAVAWAFVNIDSAFREVTRETQPSVRRPTVSSAALSVASAPHPSGTALSRSHVPSSSAPSGPAPVPVLRVPTLGLQALVAATLLAVGTALLAGFYRTSVAHPRGPPQVWPGAVFAVASWLVVSWAFGVYATSIGNYALYYGSLAAVAVLLVWLYLTSLSLIAGAELNAVLSKSRH
jgi:membrane protein